MTADKNGPEKNFSALLEHIHADGKKKWPDFSIGDTIKVHYNIIEGEKKRVQIYEGVVISIRGAGISKSIVVRRISHDVGVERIFPYHSPSVGKIEIVRKGIVRRAKLYYLRGKKGKEARIKEAREIHTKKTGSRKTKKQKSAKTEADKSGGKKKTQKKTTKVAKKTVSKKSVKTMKKTASKKKITTKKK